MVNAGEPITLTVSPTNPSAYTPEPYVLVGSLNSLLTKAAFQTVTLAPADAAAVAAQLKGLIDKLIAAGIMAAS